MNTKKKSLALLLSLVMIISLFSGVTFVSAKGAAGVSYAPVDSLIPDTEVILVAESGGSSYALSYYDGSFGSVAVTMDGDYAIVDAEKADTVSWLVDEDSYLSISGTYLYPSSSKGLLTYTGGRAISYAEGNISWSTSAGVDYLTFNGTAFGTAILNSEPAASIKLYAKTGLAKLVSAFQEDKEYAIVTQSGGKYYAFGATAANTFIAKEVTINADGDLVYSVNDDTVFWLYEDGNVKNVYQDKTGDAKPYLYPSSDVGLASYGSGRNVFFSDNNFWWKTSKGTGYLTFDSTGASFGAVSNDNSGAAAILLFERNAPVKVEEPDPIPEVYPAPEAITKTAVKNSDGTITLGFTSDIHYDGKNLNLKTWLEASGIEYIDTFGSCGDLGSAYASNADDFWSWAGGVMDYMTSLEDSGKVGDAVYTHGNHEWMASAGGDFSNSYGKYDATKKLKQVGELVVTDDYIIYAFGAGQIAINNTYDYNTNDIETLKAYLQTAPTDRPIFILIHFPLHRWESRTVKRAQMVIDALNSNPDLDLVVLWGHNHSNYDEFYYAPKFPGDKIPIDTKGTESQINFTYLAAGCTADAEYTGPSAGSAATMNKGLIVTLNTDGTRDYKYYTIDGQVMNIESPWIVRFRAGVDNYDVFETQYVDDGETVQAVTAPTMNGYDFIGWYTRAGGAEVEFDFSSPITQNTLVTAKYEKIVLPVTPAAVRDPGYVYVTIQDEQATAIGKSGDPIALYPVPYTQGMTIGDAFVKVHELEYEGGTDGVKVEDSTYGAFYLTKVWGHDPSYGSWIFDPTSSTSYIDANAEAVPGASYYALAYDSAWKSTSFMNSPSVETTVGETVTMAAMTFAMDSSYNYAAETMPGDVYCGTSLDNLEKVGTADDGYFDISFDELGEYIVVVKGDNGDAMGYISVTTPVTYRLTDSLAADVEAVLVVEADGKYYAMNMTEESAKNSAPSALEVTVSGDIIPDAPAGVVWLPSASSTLQSMGKADTFIYAGSSGLMTYTSGRSFVYNPESKHVLMHDQYWLVLDGNTFKESKDENDASTVLVFGRSHLNAHTITFESGVDGIEALTGLKLEATPYQITETMNRGGYSFVSWNTSADGSGTTYLVGNTIDADEDLTLYAQWGPAPILPPDTNGDAELISTESAVTKFTDVDEADWFVDAVQFCLDNGVMFGISETEFAPDLNTDRAMIATTLYRIAQAKELGFVGDWMYRLPFNDVEDIPAFAFEPVAWVSMKGIMLGYENGNFGPADAVTREQLAVVLYRFAQVLNLDVSVGADTNILSFNDALDISSWAVEAIQWAVGEGILIGEPGGNLNPCTTATRAEVAAMLQRFCSVLEK